MSAILEKIMTEQDAIKLAKEIERTEQALNLMKDQLKEYIKINGEVNTGNKIWYFGESVSWKFTPDNLRKLSEGILLEGKNPWEYLTITSSNLKKLGWSEDVISKYGGQKRTSTPFRSRKAV